MPNYGRKCRQYSAKKLLGAGRAASDYGLLPQSAPAPVFHTSAKSTCIPCIAQAKNLEVILVASSFSPPQPICHQILLIISPK